MPWPPVSLRNVEDRSPSLSGRRLFISVPFIPFPPIERIGVTGDRRTAALVAADGTLCWWCLPNYDGPPLFGCLLDVQKGGHWRLGPKALHFGRQHYLEGSAVLVTRWEDEDAVLELTDAMLWPESDRPSGYENRRVLVRLLRCLAGRAGCAMRFAPRRDFRQAARLAPAGRGSVRRVGGARLGLWLSKPLFSDPADLAVLDCEFDLTAGEELWAVLGPGENSAAWTCERAQEALAATLSYWRQWTAGLDCSGSRQDMIRHSGMLVHLLAYAPSGALVAAPTASLPERVGGQRNYDYRHAWIRDASLSVELLSRLGVTAEARCYLEWLSGLKPGRKMPLQVMYRIDGSRDLAPRDLRDLTGYRYSAPVRIGNAAAGMIEMGSFGFLADCMLVYLEHGGEWREEFWRLLRRAADFIAKHWRRPDAGIWELSPDRHFVASKVMSWVALDRAVTIWQKLGRRENIGHWRRAMAEIRAQVLERGWSEERRSFCQSYEGDAVDAALLLMPLYGFLPVGDRRVGATAERIAEALLVNGYLHRFDPHAVQGQPDAPLSEAEGAFLMCTFWLAHYHALCGEREKAETTLRRAEAAAGEKGLFSEAIDARSAAFLGNMPLLFSQVEYARAALALARSEAESGGALAAPEAMR